MGVGVLLHVQREIWGTEIFPKHISSYTMLAEGNLHFLVLLDLYIAA